MQVNTTPKSVMSIVILGHEFKIDKEQVGRFANKHHLSSIWFALDCDGALYMFSCKPKKMLTVWDTKEEGIAELLQQEDIGWDHWEEWKQTLIECKLCRI